ncbi:MAG: nickel-dependent lactate racemase [bacterium]|jgi:nickel-dependent lactate racemase|nr:nickel-dependent lactate racemase [candidate division KSB1 bacterium]MDH7559440.1 nickel-dependent lactate racemase [bacterium]
MELTLHYGRQGWPIRVPERNLLKVVRMRQAPPLADPVGHLRRGLKDPIGCPPLAELAKGKESACVVICDITRPVPNWLLLPPVLQTIEAAGVPRERLTILVATGTHRPNVGEELEALVGAEIASCYRVANHHSAEEAEHDYLGTTSTGTEIWLDRRYVRSALKVIIGFVEPHLMAGFSGGRKLIVPGIAGDRTMRVVHGAQMMAHPLCREGVIEGNPFHSEALEVAKRVGVDFSVNLALDEEKRLTGIFCGDLEEGHAAAVAFVRQVVTDELPAPAEIVVTTSGGAPLDATFYQAVKGVTAAAPVVKDGGTIILVAECCEGLGSPKFAALCRETVDGQDFLKRILETDYYVPDQWQWQKYLQTLRKADVLVVSPTLARPEHRCPLIRSHASFDQALQAALASHGPDAKIAVIAQGPYVLPKVGGGVQ